MRFDWNARKAAANVRNHGVSFDEAASVFLDSLSATGDDVIRIVTARLATASGKKLYEEV